MLMQFLNSTQVFCESLTIFSPHVWVEFHVSCDFHTSDKSHMTGQGKDNGISKNFTQEQIKNRQG